MSSRRSAGGGHVPPVGVCGDELHGALAGATDEDRDLPSGLGACAASGGSARRRSRTAHRSRARAGSRASRSTAALCAPRSATPGRRELLTETADQARTRPPDRGRGDGLAPTWPGAGRRAQDELTCTGRWCAPATTLVVSASYMSCRSAAAARGGPCETCRRQRFRRPPARPCVHRQPHLREIEVELGCARGLGRSASVGACSSGRLAETSMSRAAW